MKITGKQWDYMMGLLCRADDTLSDMGFTAETLGYDPDDKHWQIWVEERDYARSCLDRIKAVLQPCVISGHWLSDPKMIADYQHAMSKK
jgi:hypothetical protein